MVQVTKPKITCYFTKTIFSNGKTIVSNGSIFGWRQLLIEVASEDAYSDMAPTPTASTNSSSEAVTSRL